MSLELECFPAKSRQGVHDQVIIYIREYGDPSCACYFDKHNFSNIVYILLSLIVFFPLTLSLLLCVH